MTKYKAVKITSAKQARERQKILPSIWSDETLLTQSIIIYIAETQEKILAELRKLNRVRLTTHSSGLPTAAIDNHSLPAEESNGEVAGAGPAAA